MEENVSVPTESSQVLDDAFDRMAHAGFELPNGFVNHGAMACEALAALGFEDPIDRWAVRFSRIAGPGVTPETASSFEWEGSLGVYSRLPEWIGHFEDAVDRDGWQDVVGTWVPRLLPGLATALFHGVIRVAHAVRAVDAIDTSVRRRELALALGYWAARYRSGQPAGPLPDIDDPRRALVSAAAHGGRFYLGAPSILYLHGVTGAMAVHLLSGHLSPSATALGLAQLRAEHDALYSGGLPVQDVRAEGLNDQDLATWAEASGDPHQVKLVEACRRASVLSNDPVFLAAAELVTGHPGRSVG